MPGQASSHPSTRAWLPWAGCCLPVDHAVGAQASSFTVSVVSRCCGCGRPLWTRMWASWVPGLWLLSLWATCSQGADTGEVPREGRGAVGLCLAP